MNHGAIVLLGLLLLTIAGSMVGFAYVTQPESTPQAERVEGGVMISNYDSLYKLDESGDVVWRAPPAIYYGVERLSDDRVLAGVVVNNEDDPAKCRPEEPPCTITGARIINTSEPTRVVWQYEFPIRERFQREVHAAKYLPEREEVLIVDMDRERLFAVDVDSKQITWQWNASRRYDPPDDPRATDWLHMNDVDVIGPDRYLVSVRNPDQLLIIERGEGVVEVINKAGDESVIKEQHNPHWLGEGRVLVADSGNHRVVELRRADNGTWVPVWTLYGAGGKLFSWPRDADRLPNGNTLITDTRNRRVLEVNESGEVVWSTGAGRWVYEADRGEGEVPVDDFQTGESESPVHPLLEPAIEVGTLVRHWVPVPAWLPDHLLGLSLGLSGVGVAVTGVAVLPFSRLRRG